jgi:hypothetical protein
MLMDSRQFRSVAIAACNARSARAQGRSLSAHRDVHIVPERAPVPNAREQADHHSGGALARGNLLPYGFLCAAGLVAFFAFVVFIRSRVLTTIGLVAWFVITYVFFYRGGERKGSSPFRSGSGEPDGALGPYPQDQLGCLWRVRDVRRGINYESLKIRSTTQMIVRLCTVV